ncbi:histidine phosphatase family protein [Curvibacter sp. CHRR-16]|uniref:histidine phosphatase family protein n=1 Tax=Curvibacter sp. CHRR-16 TaxID=2835872 RepID=UPI001BD93AA6|nr:histidine phosphatase family protein [Curvibacter sp. CHRR-16]MBT0570940.1 histidine phosphatase family protein [Curvibacter sp. CHRR-16]
MPDQITRILAIRHGQTAWNVDTRIQGHTDIGLNEQGQWQAQQAAQALQGETLDAIYSSDLQRALHTAQAIARTTLPTHETVRIHTGLRERGFGLFEGKTWAEIETHWPEESRRWRQRDPQFAPEGGETLLQLRERVHATFSAIASQHQGQHIAIVTHGGVLDMLYRLATSQELYAPRTWELANAGFNRLLWTPEGFSLIGWADVGHLDNPSPSTDAPITQPK